MSAGGELRESVALLVSEWRLLALGLGGPIVYGTWVVLTGLVLDIGTPALKRAVATTVAGTPIRGLELLALLGWVVLPSLVAIAAVQRQLFNRHDNLANCYRMAEPGVLLVVPSVALVACLVALVVNGWSLPLVVALLVVTVHFLVRTAAFGYRVYTLSLPRTLLAMIGVSAVSLVVGLLVRLPSVAARDPRLASRVALAGVAEAVQAWTTLLGVDQALLLRGTLFVPIVLSSCYLLAQTTVASIAKRRGLPTAPKRRPGQRVPESAQPSAATSDTRVVSEAETEQPDTEPDEMQDTVVTEPEQTPTGEPDGTPSAASPAADSTPSAATTEAESSETTAEEDDHSGTRVFSPNEPVPSAGGDGSPDDPFADDDTTTEHDSDGGEPTTEDDSDSDEPPTAAARQEPAQDAVNTPTSSTETDAVEEQTVVVDDPSTPTDAVPDESPTREANGSASADDSTATDPATTDRPVVPIFEAAAGDSDDESAGSGTGEDDSRAPATAPVLPRFEPASADSRASDDTGGTVSHGDVRPRFEASETPRSNHAAGAADRRVPKVLPVFEAAADSEQSATKPRRIGGRDQRGDVLPQFEPAPTDDGAVQRATRQREDVVSVFEAAAEPDSSAGESGSRPRDGDVVPQFEATHEDGDAEVEDAQATPETAPDADVIPTFETAAEYGGIEDEPASATEDDPVSAPERADTVITDQPDDRAPVDAGLDEAATDTGEDQPPAEPEQIDCPSCGRSVRDSADICYCPGCGTALER